MEISQNQLFERAARKLHPTEFRFFITYYDYLCECGYTNIIIEDGDIFIE